MAATIWKGHLSFGLVSIPVRLVRAARAQRIPLRQLYRPRENRGSGPRQAPELESKEQQAFSTGDESGYARPQSKNNETERAGLLEIAPVKRVYQAASDQPADGDERIQPIQSTDLVKGYESSKGQFIVVDEQDLRRIEPKTSTEVEIVEFVRFDEIDPVYLETSYYVVPEANGEKAYALLYGAMQEERFAAIANVSMHRRDHVLIIRTGKTGLIAHTMFYADEVRTMDEFRANTNLASAKEFDLAKTFIHALAKPFEPGHLKNQFREQLMQLIESRTPEYRMASPEAPNQDKVVDIMDALRRSLAQVQPATHQKREITEQAPTRKPTRAEQPARTNRNRSTNR